MMRCTRVLVSAWLLSVSSLMHAADTPPIPYFSIRSQGANLPRQLAGIGAHIHNPPCNRPCGYGSLVFAYTNTMNADRITRCLFGSALRESDCAIKISGKDVAGRAPTDWLADYFYLPSDFQSTLSFRPKIDSIIFEASWHLTLDQWIQGLYVHVDAPLTVTRWDLRLCEEIGDKGSTAHPAGYFTPQTFDRSNLLNDFSSYAQGSFPPVDRHLATEITPPAAGTEIKTTFSPLRHAKMSCKGLKTTRAADLRAIIGWDCTKENGSAWGIKAVIVGPAGNRPKGEYLFEPIAGNGHHWELGAGLRASILLGKSCEHDTTARLYLDGYISHLFGSRQTRTFDLDDKPFSRYMLATRHSFANKAEEIPVAVDHFLRTLAPTILATSQFKGEYRPVANLTTSEVMVNAAVQAELVAMLALSGECFSCGIGYNFWGRTCEKIVRRCQTPLDIEQKTWTLKGDARVFGFMSAASGVDLILDGNAPVALAVSQSRATINAGTNGTPTTNEGIDNKQPAWAAGTNAGNPHTLRTLRDTPGGADQINTSLQPRFLKPGDIRICQLGTSGMSHKVFGHLSYEWHHCPRFTPMITIGGEAEFGHNELRCKGCSRCAISQWGIWIKGTVHFSTHYDKPPVPEPKKNSPSNSLFRQMPRKSVH